MRVSKREGFDTVGQLKSALAGYADDTPLHVVAYGDVDDDQEAEDAGILVIRTGVLYEDAQVGQSEEGLVILVDLAMHRESDL